MPGGDRTGPTGGGPMTGRRMGYCAGFGATGSLHPGEPSGLGRAWGSWGAGRGWRHGRQAVGRPGWMHFSGWQPTKEQDLEALKAQAEWLSGQHPHRVRGAGEVVRARIDEIEGKGD